MTATEDRLAELLHAAVPSSRGVAFDDIARRVRHRRRLRRSVLGSVVAVVGVAVLVTVVDSTGFSRSPGPATTPTVEPSNVVPWIDRPAPPYAGPTVPPPPIRRTDARACTARDVVTGFGETNGAGGHSVVYVQFRNTSTTSCVLKGYPRVVVSQPGLPDVVATRGSYFASSVGSANMAPGDVTYLDLETAAYCAAQPNGGPGGPLYHHLAISLPGGGTVALDRPSGFDVICEFRVSAFLVPEPPQSVPHDPLTDLRATLDLPSGVRAGATFRYVVAVSNPTGRPVRLDPCPGYLQSASTLVKQTYALNCAPVGSIAAHATVRFEMRMALPAATPRGPLTVHWILLNGSAPPASGSVQVA